MTIIGKRRLGDTEWNSKKGNRCNKVFFFNFIEFSETNVFRKGSPTLPIVFFVLFNHLAYILKTKKGFLIRFSILEMKVLHWYITFLIAVGVCIAQQQRKNILFSVQMVSGTRATPTCIPATSLSLADGAFVCYRDAHGTGSVRHVPLLAGVVVNSTVLSIDDGLFVSTPVIFSPGNQSASVFSVGNTSWAMLTPTSILDIIYDTSNTTGVVLDLSTMISFVPVYHAPTTTVVAARISPLDGITQELWQHEWSSAIPTPVVFQQMLFLVVGSSLVCVNEETNVILWNVTNPCGLQAATGDQLHIQRIDFGDDAPSALFIFGNTTSSEISTFDICRVDYRSGVKEWSLQYAHELIVESVVGGGGNTTIGGFVVLSARLVTPPEFPDLFVVFSINAQSGRHSGSIFRSEADKLSHPAFFSTPPAVAGGCNGSTAVALQVNGVLAAFCPGATLQEYWRTTFTCDQTPTVVPLTNWIVCVTALQSVAMFTSTGELVWIDESIRPAFQAAVVENVVVVVDDRTTTWGLSVNGVPFSSAPDSGNNTAVVVSCALVVVVAVVLGVLGIMWRRRMRSRRAGLGEHALVYGSVVEHQ